MPNARRVPRLADVMRTADTRPDGQVRIVPRLWLFAHVAAPWARLLSGSFPIRAADVPTDAYYSCN
jgi:hypothetical protein